MTRPFIFQVPVTIRVNTTVEFTDRDAANGTTKDEVVDAAVRAVAHMLPNDILAVADISNASFDTHEVREQPAMTLEFEWKHIKGA
jgi:hypothetical protein